jgi:hypothetical protein
MWGHLSKALRTQGGNPADVVANAAAPDEKHGYENELVSQLSDEDRQLLQKMRSKLGSLKTALRAETSPAEEVERRLLNDVRYAKQNGVSLKQVLRALMAARENA